MSTSALAEATPVEIVKAYYAAYNAHDTEKQIALMTKDIIHAPNQGEKTTGVEHYRAFNTANNASFDEDCVELKFFTSPDSKKVIAESYAVGKYVKDMEGYPKAKNQPYRSHVVEVFEFAGGKIKSLATYYNEKDWIAQISK